MPTIRPVVLAIPILCLLLGSCHDPETAASRSGASVSIQPRLQAHSRRASVAAHGPRPASQMDACAILEELDSDPERAIGAIVAEPARFARAHTADCVISSLDTLARRFRREEDSRYLDAIALVWKESDGEVATSITMDIGVMLLDEAFDATLDYLFQHRDQNDMETVIVEAAVAIISSSDDPMAEMSAFREDFRDHARGLPRDERRYLAGLLRRIVARATFDDGRDRGRTI